LMESYTCHGSNLTNPQQKSSKLHAIFLLTCNTRFVPNMREPALFALKIAPRLRYQACHIFLVKAIFGPVLFPAVRPTLPLQNEPREQNARRPEDQNPLQPLRQITRHRVMNLQQKPPKRFPAREGSTAMTVIMRAETREEREHRFSNFAERSSTCQREPRSPCH